MLSQLGGSNWEQTSSTVDKENASPPPKQLANSKGGVASPKPALTPTWLFNSAMITAPVDLSALVTMSRDHPQAILDEFGLLNQMVGKVLNAPDASTRIDKDTRLDVLLIFGNLCLYGDEFAREKTKKVLAGVSTWFEKYVEIEKKATPNGKRRDPELHKAMLVLLARAFEYKLKTEDLLELTGGNRAVALESCVGVLEDGEVIVTEIAQKAKPQDGKRGQWEEKAAVVKHEKELVLQMCELLQGFTRAESYFSRLEDGFYFMEAGLELPEYCIDQFGVEIDQLLHLTMETKLVEKLAKALNRELFSEGKVLTTQDHQAVAAVHSFLGNMYLYSCGETETFRTYLLTDTLLVPHVVIPYLERCVYHAAVLSRRAAASKAALADFGGFGDDLPGVLDLVAEVSDASLDYPELIAGVEATLRTLIIASFRAPRTRLMFQLLQRFNPTASLLRMKSFVSRHDYIFSLLCLLNVNMGAFDITGAEEEEEQEEGSSYMAYAMLAEVLSVFEEMHSEKQRRVLRRIEMSGALPVARDTPSYQALIGVMWGGGNASFGYAARPESSEEEEEEQDSLGLDDDDDFGGGDALGTCSMDFGETAYFKNARADVKAEAAARLEERSEDLYLEELIRARVDATKAAMLRTGRDLQADAWVDAALERLEGDPELGDDLSTNEMERLDDLVHADLMACQDEMRVLAAEVRALQDGGGGDDDDDGSGWGSEDEEEVEEGEEAWAATDAEAKEDSQEDAQEEKEAPKAEAALLSTLEDDAVPVETKAEGKVTAEETKAAVPVDTKAEEKASVGETEAAVPVETKADGKVSVGKTEAAVPVETKAEGKASAEETEATVTAAVEKDAPGKEAAAALEEVAPVPAALKDPLEAPSGENQAQPPRRRKAPKAKAELATGPLPKAQHQRSLLGDLPSLERKSGAADLSHFVNLKLELPKLAKTTQAGKGLRGPSGKKVAKGVEPSMACAINGHLMKDPVRAPNGIVFERATILLWLETRGQVCPISGKPLTAENLAPDAALRQKIMRRHIAASMGNGGAPGKASVLSDDLYEF